MSDNKVNPRDRISSGVSKQRLQTEAKRSLGGFIIFLAGLALALVITVVIALNINPSFGKSQRTVRFEIDNVFGIFEGFDEVRYRGEPAGTIKEIDRDVPQPILVLSIDEDVGPIYKDAVAELRPITPLNDVFLDIVDPGTEAAGEADPNVPLPVEQTSTNVTVPDVLDAFQPDVQRNFRTLLDQLGNGTEDGGVKLRRDFVELAPFLSAAGDLTKQIAIRKDATKRLIHNTGVLTRELARRENDLRRLLVTGSATFATLQDGSSDLDATLRELAPTFTELRTTLGAVDGVVDDVDTGLTSLYPIAERLPHSLVSIRRVNSALSPAVRQLGEPILKGAHWLRVLKPVARNLNLSFRKLGRQAPTLNHLVDDLVACEAPIIGFFQWNSSLTKFGDVHAPVPRGNLAAAPPNVGLPGEVIRTPFQGCTRGPTIGGRPAEPGDQH